jgi:hypothetical protein
VYAAIVRLIGLGSVVVCVIVIASFALFAVNQTSQASSHQQQLLGGEPATEAGSRAPAPKTHKSSVRKAIDDASEWLTSPFDGVTSSSHSEWQNHAIDLGLALAVYGFGFGFLARTLRVRV